MPANIVRSGFILDCLLGMVLVQSRKKVEWLTQEEEIEYSRDPFFYFFAAELVVKATKHTSLGRYIIIVCDVE
jgi:hypothetical protein